MAVLAKIIVSFDQNDRKVWEKLCQFMCRKPIRWRCRIGCQRMSRIIFYIRKPVWRSGTEPAKRAVTPRLLCGRYVELNIFVTIFW